MNKGMPIELLSGIVAATEAGDKVKKYNLKGFNAVIVHHHMSSETAGGFNSLKMSNAEDGEFVAHHGKGTNIKTQAEASSYTCIYEGCMDWIELTVDVTDGTHTIVIVPCNV